MSFHMEHAFMLSVLHRCRRRAEMISQRWVICQIGYIREIVFEKWHSLCSRMTAMLLAHCLILYLWSAKRCTADLATHAFILQESENQLGDVQRFTKRQSEAPCGFRIILIWRDSVQDNGFCKGEIKKQDRVCSNHNKIKTSGKN